MSDDAIAHLRTDLDLTPLVEEHGPLELEPAEGLLAAEETTLEEAGLSRRKTEYVRAAARARLRPCVLRGDDRRRRHPLTGRDSRCWRLDSQDVSAVTELLSTAFTLDHT